MSTSFDELLGMNSPSFYVPTSSSSGSYFPAFEGLTFDPASLGGNHELASGLKMEETLDFSSQALAPYGDLLGDHFHDGQLGLPLPSFVNEAPFKTEKSVSPTSFMEEEDDEEEEHNPKWELELEQLISEFDGEVPIDCKLKEELLHASVKDFNRRSRSMKLDPKAVQYLKMQRKRMKNRQAAIRSRSRKETRVCDLERQVEHLQGEKHAQLMLIRHLQARTELLEKELAKAKTAPA